MANVLVDNTALQNIANAIRTMSGGTDTYLPSAMATAILNLPSGGLVYEEGTFAGTEVTTKEVSFSNTHTKPPAILLVFDTSNTVYTTSSSMGMYVGVSIYHWNGVKLQNSSTSSTYGTYSARGFTGGSSNGVWNTATSVTNVMNASRFKISTSYYFRTGRTYRWIAIWNE